MKPRFGFRRAFDEESCRFSVLQGWHTIDRFTIDTKRLATRGDDLEIRAGAQKLICVLSASFDEMLAVIEQEEYFFGTQIINDGSDERDTLHFTQVEHESD